MSAHAQLQDILSDLCPGFYNIHCVSIYTLTFLLSFLLRHDPAM